MILFSKALAEKLGSKGVLSYSVDPGGECCLYFRGNIRTSKADRDEQAIASTNLKRDIAEADFGFLRKLN